MRTAAVFHPSSELYGADRIMVQTLKAFPKDTRFLIYLREDGPLVELIDEHIANKEIIIDKRMPVIYRAIFSPRGILHFLGNLRYWKTRMKADLDGSELECIYVNTLSCSFVLYTLRRMAVKKIIHVHEIIDFPKVVGKVTAFLCSRFADHTVVVSDAVKRKLDHYIRFKPNQIRIMHNGIAYPKEIKESLLNPKINFYLFGRIHPNKGQEYLLNSIKHINRSVLEEARFILVGGVAKNREQDLHDLQRIIKDNALEEYVVIKGFMKDIEPEMLKSDVCLIPSKMKDPFPTTVLEAMSYGKAVIATNHGGAAEVIHDGENGYLISPDAEAELSDRIERLIRNKEMIRDFGKKSRALFLSSYTSKHYFERWTSFFSEFGYFE